MPYPGATTYPGASLFPGASTTPARDITLAVDLVPFRLAASGADVPREIPVSLGAVEYVGALVTETTGQALNASSVRLALGTYDTPGTFATPDVATNPSTSSVLAKLLVGTGHYMPTPTKGRFWIWTLTTDSPEVLPVRTYSAVTIS